MKEVKDFNTLPKAAGSWKEQAMADRIESNSLSLSGRSVSSRGFSLSEYSCTVQSASRLLGSHRIRTDQIPLPFACQHHPTPASRAVTMAIFHSPHLDYRSICHTRYIRALMSNKETASFLAQKPRTISLCLRSTWLARLSFHCCFGV